jgi:hypothetical protein
LSARYTATRGRGDGRGTGALRAHRLFASGPRLEHHIEGSLGRSPKARKPAFSMTSARRLSPASFARRGSRRITSAPILLLNSCDDRARAFEQSPVIRRWPTSRPCASRKPSSSSWKRAPRPLRRSRKRLATKAWPRSAGCSDGLPVWRPGITGASSTCFNSWHVRHHMRSGRPIRLRQGQAQRCRRPILGAREEGRVWSPESGDATVARERRPAIVSERGEPAWPEAQARCLFFRGDQGRGAKDLGFDRDLRKAVGH